MVNWLNASGWQADFHQADEQLNRQADRLRSLVGQRIVETWTVVTSEDEWWESQPVILRFDDGRRLEVCWSKTDELSITWNTIDVAVDPDLFEDLPLSWRPDLEPAARSVLGERVTEVLAVGWQETTGRRWRRRSPTQTYGLWLGTERGGLHIFNAFDLNGVSTTYPSDEEHHCSRPV